MNTRSRIGVVVLLIFCIALLTACPSNNSETQIMLDHPELEKTIDKILSREKFSGSVLLAKKGQVLLSKGYGMADFANKIPNTSSTIFRIGSITKQFTALIILQLDENKLLSINDKINKYIPDYPHGDQITLEHLLTQTSGIPEHTTPENIRSIFQKYTTPQEIIETFKYKPLHFVPGTKYEYSNSNYILLGYVIEQVTGKTYRENLEKNILEPLKMRNSGYDSNTIDSKSHALGYSGSMDDYQFPEYQVDMSVPYAAGAMYSTVEDMYLWDQALYTETLASKDTIKKLFVPYIDFPEYPYPTSYGYGWFVYKDKKGLVGHGGKIFGYTSMIHRNLEEKSVVIVLSNLDMDVDKIEKIVRELHSHL